MNTPGIIISPQNTLTNRDAEAELREIDTVLEAAHFFKTAGSSTKDRVSEAMKVVLLHEEHSRNQSTLLEKMREALRLFDPTHPLIHEKLPV